MPRFTVRLHLTLASESRRTAQASAVQLGEALADAAENWAYPDRLISCCVDNPGEVTLDDAQPERFVAEEQP